MKQLPGQLKGNEGFARAGRQRQQDAFAVVGDGFEHALDGDVLIIASLKIPAAIFKRNRREPIAPVVLGGKSHLPQLFRRRVMRLLAFRAFVHVYGVNALAVGRVVNRTCSLPA